ncbi:hypothetical protein FBULB1_11153 [Fusarium bulbicola]|nr:hypothetical protein FBULB1_11153 [Fusarium bulbicola]
MVDKASIDNFSRISESPHLVEHIKDLRFHTLHLLPIEELEGITPSFLLEETDPDATTSTPPNMSLDFSESGMGETHIRCYEQQQSLMAGTLMGIRLHEAMSKIKSRVKLSFDSDHPPWSTPRLKQSFGCLIQRSLAETRGSTKFISGLIQTVLNAAWTSGLQIEDLDIPIGLNIDNSLCITLDQFPLLPFQLSSLSHLHLVIEPTFKTNLLQKFLNSFPNLIEFNLEVYSELSRKKTTGALHDLQIPKLQQLTLSMVSCTAEELQALIIAHHKTLRDITLICIHLPDYKSWRNIFQLIVTKLNLNDFYIGECEPGDDDDWLDIENVQELMRIVDGTD